MRVIQQFTLMNKQLTPAERKVAAYVIDYPELVLKENVGQLAEAAGASAATVIRVFKKSEWQNLAQFKIALSSDLAMATHGQKVDVTPHDNFDVVRGKLLNNAIESLKETSSTIDKHSVLKLIDLIGSAKQVYLLGLGASSLVAENIAQKWGRVGVQMMPFQEMNVFLPVIETATTDDLIWFISNSGETPEVVWAAQAAKKRHLKTASLTKLDVNTLSSLTDVQLRTSTPIETRVRSAATNSLLSQFLVIDIVFYFYLSQFYDKSFDSISRTHEIIQDYHRDLRN